ncbi:MAG TPA: hypothetical protein VMJ11_23700 [Paraburkholderia sp.]|nr:hypothetical protein [Paraburkholderia sp.]HTR09603.1 hypothetical protein [Paraburkholderia sp.]
MKPYLIAILVIVAVATTIAQPMACYAHDRADGYAGPPPTGFRK